MTDSNTQVQQHYAEVAQEVLASLEADAVCGRSSCCDAPLRASEAAVLYTADEQAALPQGALSASRGCGDPVAKAQLRPGEYVLDLGSGGGIDALIASQILGQTGFVYGVDMTPDMIELATRNAADAGCANVSFIKGTIEDLPLEDASVDVVLSNCVINFSNDKPRVIAEAARVLKPGGRFVVSDIVSNAPIAQDSYWPLCRIVGCTNGMQPQEDYRQMLLDAGFVDVVLEPKTIYTLDVLERKAQQKDRMELFAQIADDPTVSEASGSVIIYAYK